MNKINKSYLALLVITLSLEFMITNVKASSLIEVEQPCSFEYSYSEVNEHRAHWDGDTAELDLGANSKPPGVSAYQSCSGEKALASISGSITTGTYSFYCKTLKGNVTNSELKIAGDNSITTVYTHMSDYTQDPDTGSTITSAKVGEVIGTIGAVGCVSDNFKHIHFDVRKNGVRQNFSKWEFKELCTPPESGDWIIDQDCAINDIKTAPANVEVRGSSTVTIGSEGKLVVDFENYALTVKNNSKVVIKEGGRVT